jgi:hypothetical protein
VNDFLMNTGIKVAEVADEVAFGSDACVKERFLILARESGTMAEGLRKVLEPLGKVEVIVDRLAGERAVGARCSGNGLEQDASATVYVPDAEAEGYGGLMSRSGNFSSTTAWSRAFVHLERTLEDDEAVWFVEDDVAGDMGSFAEFVGKTAARNADLSAIDLRAKRDDAHWSWWGYAEEYFEEPCRGFQPMCRLSGSLVRALLEFRRQHGTFTFHEVLFASVAGREGMSWLSWNLDAEFRHHLTRFRYRPEVMEVVGGICHPVKDPEVHAAICAALAAEFPRLTVAKCEDWSIGREDYVFLARHCRRHGIQKVAEFGPGDSTHAFLDAECRVVSYEHDLGWLRKSLDRFDGERNVELVHCPEGSVPDLAPFVPEIVFVDGPPYREGQKFSRLQACEWALETCGHLVLHDARRRGEEATLAELERRGMLVTRIPTRKGLAHVTDPTRCAKMKATTADDALARYGGGGTKGWYREDFYAWSVLFGVQDKPARVLEVGAGNGTGVCLMLDLLFTHPESEVHAIDFYDGQAGVWLRGAFEKNAVLGGHLESNRLHLYEGLSREVLAWMIAEEGYWGSFDFVHLAAPGDGPSLLADACQAWELLKPGGMMALEGFGVEIAGAAEAFLAVYAGRLRKILVGSRIVVTKHAAG